MTADPATLTGAVAAGAVVLTIAVVMLAACLWMLPPGHRVRLRLRHPEPRTRR